MEQEERKSEWSNFAAAWKGEAPVELNEETKATQKALELKEQKAHQSIKIGLNKDNISQLLQSKSEEDKEKIIKDAVIEANSLVDKIDEEIKNDTARNVKNYGIPVQDTIEEREYTEEETQDEVKSNVAISIDPSTGEHKITGLEEFEEDKEFNELVDHINSSDDDYFEIKDISEEDIKNYTQNPDKNGVLSNITNDDFQLSPKSMTTIIDIIDRRAKRESFNVYRSLPSEVKKSIDDYVMSTPAASLPIKEINRFKNQLAESIISEFVMNIQIKKSKEDFATDLEKIYATDNKNNKFASEEERFEAYNKEADKIEDENKKKRMKEILAKIDEARNLDTLAEFAKNCKIKKIEVEKYQSRIFSSFLDKYKSTAKNIYDINIGLAVVTRHMLEYDCSFEESIKFMIVFCKFVQNYSPDNYLEHAYMYYVLYYCAMLDTEKNKTFTDNIFKVISAIREKEGI